MPRLKVSLSFAQIDETFPFSEAVLPLNDVCEPVIYNTPIKVTTEIPLHHAPFTEIMSFLLL